MIWRLILTIGLLATSTLATAVNMPLAGLDGDQGNLTDYRGKWGGVNYWATWCPPCIRELPALDRLQGRLGGDDFAVVTLALDAGGAAEAAPFFTRLGIRHLALYVDPERRIGELLPDDVLPASFFLDREGRVKRRGADPRTA